MKLSYIVLGILIFLASSIPIMAKMSQNSQNLVTLQAAEGDNGLIHLWSSAESGPSARYMTIPEDISCQKVDGQEYRLVIGDQTLIYFKLRCNGITGYVDSTRIVK